MKLSKNIWIEAIYQGEVPIESTDHWSSDFDEIPDGWGHRKYVGYDHLFYEVRGYNFTYGNSRAKTLNGYSLKKGDKVKILCNWRSSIITNIKKIYKVNGGACTKAGD